LALRLLLQTVCNVPVVFLQRVELVVCLVPPAPDAYIYSIECDPKELGMRRRDRSFEAFLCRARNTMC
jgi:hypothetical protein